MTTAGTLTTLYNFNTTDGWGPYAGLTLGFDGNFYGTTSYGGPSNAGTIFKITPEGTLTTLHAFASTDGSKPLGAPIQAIDGNFYGLTTGGGALQSLCNDGQIGCGTVYKMTPEGALTTLYSFSGPDGAQPRGALVEGRDGNFYGTTDQGMGNATYGTVFKITPVGALTTLYFFCSQSNCSDGATPEAGLMQAANGLFLGTTVQGGFRGNGTVFSINSQGKLTTLHPGDWPMMGGQPQAGLMQATDGNFYGTTTLGGGAGAGTLFEIIPGAREAILHNFSAPEGAVPTAALYQATDGNLYGTTAQGGTSNVGTVFSLSTGLAPFVRVLPHYGKAGSAVAILGSNLAGATSVTFDGTPAVFTIISPSLIRTMVPAGAATGSVQVVTPGQTLSSNVLFHVAK